MADASTWDWKARDGRRGGLLYESGNWGDFLKLLWLTELLRWKTARVGPEVGYFDPFAGAVEYPIGHKFRFRFDQAGLASLDYIRAPFVERGAWPSSAAAAGLLTSGRQEVYDIDAARRRAWLDRPGVTIMDGESGWTLLADHAPDPDGVWLVDPYDFLADWRTWLPVVAAQSRTTTTLLYLYNRSARAEETFREYRAFKNALADLLDDVPCRLGRAAADAFLPRAHHEIWLLPGRADLQREGYPELTARLGERSAELAAAMARAAVFDAP